MQFLKARLRGGIFIFRIHVHHFYRQIRKKGLLFGKKNWRFFSNGSACHRISCAVRNVGYMSELEEARLPYKLEELAACPAEDTVRALRRDHRQVLSSLGKHVLSIKVGGCTQ